MSIENSPQISSISKHYEINIGHLYFFDHYVVAEFNEGVNIDFECFNEASELIKSIYNERPFGFIANRINSYSIVLTEAKKFNDAFKNIATYAIVTYSSLSEKIFEIENHFFEFNRQMFKSVEEAINWTEKELKNLN